MTNAEGMTKPETGSGYAIWSFVMRSFFRLSSFVIRHSAATTLLAATAVLLLFGPTASAVDVLEEIVEQKYTLDPNATLSISNTDGSIRIYGHAAAEISIQAIKKAYAP